MKSTDTINIVSAKYIKDYIIQFHFSDGKINDIDFYSFLSKPSQNPLISKYLDIIKFKNFKIIDKSYISWNDYEMCYDFDDLYKGKI